MVTKMVIKGKEFLQIYLSGEPKHHKVEAYREVINLYINSSVFESVLKKKIETGEEGPIVADLVMTQEEEENLS